MTRRKSTRLSAGELEIMQVLWRLSTTTLAEARAALGRPLGYTTVQTRLNRLVDKGVVRRSNDRPARYAPVVRADEVGAGHLDLLLERVSGGSVVPLVAHLVRDRDLSPTEIAQLKQLIRDAEQRRRAEEQQP
ncbi:MAG: BlaI/MecI/CopY family transcriptional regulator [Pirellulales bacterium]